METKRFIWAENDFHYNENETLHSLEPLYPTNNRMIAIFCCNRL